MEVIMASLKTRRAYTLVDHFGQERHPVDDLVQRDPRQRALRERIRRASRKLDRALGPRRDDWLDLESKLAELAAWREEAFFEIGHEHGFAAGRAEDMASTPAARSLAAALRDHAIQSGLPRETALGALLEAAWALATKRTPRTARRSPR